MIQQRLLPPEPEPRIVLAAPQNYKDEAQRLEENYFVCIGFSGFVGGNPNQKQLVTQAKKVGADVAIHASEYSYTEQGVRPIFTYQPGQTYHTTHSGTANTSVYGSGGYASGYGTYSGTSTTTTPGTLRKDYVPYQQPVYQFGASFWRRVKPGIFGAHFSVIPEELRITLQRNIGVYIEKVMINSPAFRANLMKGDVIIQFADKPIATLQELTDLLPSYAGQKVVLKIIRATQTIDIEIRLDQSI